MANYKTFLQYDSRWGSKNYNGSSTMAMAGCGPTSVADLAYAVNKKVNPWTVAKFMKENGYAIYNNGTAWSGIPAAMKHFGLKDVKNVSAMSDVFKYIKKRYCAVFLMKAGTRGGVTWTTAGHYIAVTNYKKKNGKHYFYTRDCGGRGHTGWYCYDTKMKGLISQVWVGYVPGNLKPKKTIKTKGDKINEMAVKEAYPYGTPRKVYTYPTGKPRPKYTKELNKAFPNRSSWRDQTRKGASCDVFAATAIRSAGVDDKFPRMLADAIPYLGKSKKWGLVKSHKGKTYPPSILRAGDIGVCLYKYGGGHIFVIVKVNGKKYIAEAGYNSKRYPIIAKKLTTMHKSSYKMLRVYRKK